MKRRLSLPLRATAVLALLAFGAGDAMADEPAPAAACDSLLDAMWTAAAAALEALGTPDVASLEDRYRGGASTFLERCAANLTDEQRACLLASPDPLSAMGSCGVAALPPRERPFPPALDGFVTVVDRPALSAEDAGALLARLVGTWHNDWATAREQRTWAVAPDGGVTEVFVARDDPPETRNYTIELPQAQRMRIHTTPSSSQVYSFYLQDDDTFYLSSNLVYDVFPVPDRDHFVLAHDHNYLLHGPDGCRVYSKNGASGTIDCRFETGSDGEHFLATYTVPDALSTQGEPLEYEADYLVRDGYFIDARMLDFHRQ